jgi:ectoine hydroxylase-related dioxygenase (phytanoyl-CoA dioxygenase family)
MLTDDQVQFFHDNGYLIMRGLISQRDIAAMRAAVDELQADAIRRLSQPEFVAALASESPDWIEHPDIHYVYRRKPDSELSFFRIERMYTRQPVFKQFAMSRALLENAWQILGRPFWPRAGSLVVKLPHEGAAIRWHQDIPYLYWSSGGHRSKGRPTTHPVPNFTTDIYLESSNESNGCLYALPGSHKNGTVDVDKLVAEHGFNLPGAVPLELEPGDAMFHHTAVVHGSPENHSAGLRRTFYIHYLSDETVHDAYSDWPDLMTSEECQAFWSDAMKGRHPDGDSGFSITPDGIVPAEVSAAKSTMTH